ncbi:MAG TPA: YsnF/AvaK domain-containing protein [Actinomycetes bacterium]|nr:YsnF/AvaK domain-containing protein [Actinomycetes bacterium]
MADIGTVHGWRGHTMMDRDGGLIGRIDAIYVDDRSGQPEWALVSLGAAGTTSTFVPIAQATVSGSEVRVPYDRQLVKDAPGTPLDRPLSVAEERQLFRHYGLDYDASHAGTPRQGPAGTTDAALPATAREAGHDTTEPASNPGRDTRQAASGQTGDDAMTRSEEELRVGTQTRERGRVRLRKYVTTEEQQVTVPVRREEVRLEHEPPADANVDAATSDPKATDAGHEVVLHEEQPVVDKRVVPKERVRLDKETVTDQQQVTEEVRKEQIDVQDHSRSNRRP